MTGRASKRKGSNFENHIMKELREIVPFVGKTLGSGSSEDNADIDHFGPFLIECKHHRTISEAELVRWWKKIVGQAEPVCKIPVIIYKENHQPIRVRMIAVIMNTVDIGDYKTWMNGEPGRLVIDMDYESWKNWIRRK